MRVSPFQRVDESLASGVSTTASGNPGPDHGDVLGSVRQRLVDGRQLWSDGEWKAMYWHRETVRKMPAVGEQNRMGPVAAQQAEIRR